MPPPEPLVTPKEFAGILKLSMRTFYRLQHGRDFPVAVRVGRCVRFRREDVDHYIAKHQRAR